MKNSYILINQQDGDRSDYNLTYVAIKIDDKELRNYSDSWTWTTPEENKLATENARSVAKKLASKTGLKIRERLWLNG